MELQVDVDEADVGKVGSGQNASFSVDARRMRSSAALESRAHGRNRRRAGWDRNPGRSRPQSAQAHQLCWSRSRSPRPPCRRLVAPYRRRRACGHPTRRRRRPSPAARHCHRPSLDDLVAVEISPDRVFECRNEEGRRLSCRCRSEIGTHRHTFGITEHRRTAGIGIGLDEVVTA